MVILHIANVTSEACNGVYVVVPQHVRSQETFAEVGFVNLFDYEIEKITHQFICPSRFSLDMLPNPFNKPDLVVFHEVYRPKFLQIARVLQKARVPYIIIPHGSLTKEAQHLKWAKKTIANILLFNRFIKNAKAIQCLSDKELNNTKFKTYKFIGTNGIYMPAIQKSNFSENQLEFVYIGRLDMHIKGLDLMLGAIQLSKTFLLENNCKFNIYGPDFQGSFHRLQELIDEKGVQDLVALHSAITGEAKSKVLCESDVFIQTSRSEGMPMGILEAMSYGIPCLVTAGTALAEFVDEHDAGWACETSVNGIAQAIRQVIENKGLLYRKSQNAKDAVKENFSWEQVAFNTIEKYRDILEK